MNFRPAGFFRQRMFRIAAVIVAILALGAVAQVVIPSADSLSDAECQADSSAVAMIDTTAVDTIIPSPFIPLSDSDLDQVAEKLGIETAAMKAVVQIEAGKTHRGFDDSGRPLVNFDLSVFRRMAAKNKVNLQKYTNTHPTVFHRTDAAKYGSHQAAAHARLEQALTIDSVTAIEGTFWGMFQIGGFNWKLCGTESPQQFMELMSRSERDQLDLFCEFITRSGLLQHLKSKNWRAFARGYNGPAYAKRGYHTRLANTYNKFKKETE